MHDEPEANNVGRKQRIRRSRQEIAAILEELERSGQSAASFARERGLNAGWLRRWSKRLEREPADSASGALFEVTSLLRNEGAQVEVLFPGGVTVRVPAACSGEVLRRALLSVRAAGC